MRFSLFALPSALLISGCAAAVSDDVGAGVERSSNAVSVAEVAAGAEVVFQKEKDADGAKNVDSRDSVLPLPATETAGALPVPAEPQPLPELVGVSGTKLVKAPESPVVNWLNDLSEAESIAASENKDIAVVFMGDDLNPWCRQLDSEVFSRPAFALSANKHFVFVLIDSSQAPAPDEKGASGNVALREAWGVRALPTIVLADQKGRPYAVTGYRNMGGLDYALQMESLRRIREQRDLCFAAARQETGSVRAVYLAQALRAMDDEIVLRHYAGEFAELKQLDPENETGLAGNIEFMPKLNALRSVMLGKIRNNRDYAGALKCADDFITRESPTGEHLQRALFLKLNVYGSAEKRDHAAVVALMNAIIEIDPRSEPGQTAVDVRARAQALLAGARAVPEP